MAASIFIILFWLGHSKFSLDRDLVRVTPKEFNKLLELR